MEKQEDVSHVAVALSGGRAGLGEHGLVLGLRLQLDGVHVGHFGIVWSGCVDLQWRERWLMLLLSEEVLV